MLEAALREDNAFVTLTYADENLPMISNLGISTLMPKHLRDWLKRYRKALSPLLIRYFAVGEYGDDSWRPHYHAAIFGAPTCRRGRTYRAPGKTRALWKSCCDVCELVGTTWGHGDVDLGILETSSAQYVAGYVTKKMTRRDDFRLRGREPEFSRMSLKPGIGFDMMHEVASSILQFNLETRLGDVPVTLAHGRRQLPLGRYLRRNLRKMIGRDEKTPDEVLAARQEELRPVREAAFDASQSFASKIVEENAGKRARFYARRALKQGKRHL